MSLKRFTRISEWGVEIDQGIPGIHNLGFPGKVENANGGNYVMVQIGCGDMFTVSVLLSGPIYCRYYKGYLQFRLICD